MLKRVAVVSIAPVLPGAVHGGSQRILDGVLLGLADAGADVRVICSWRPENDGGFEIAPRIKVEPLLRLSGYFPDPWEAPPHRILQSAEALAPVFEWAESVYLHADTFYLRKLIPEGRRVVRSFHDFHYETALISAFAFDADLTIVPSEYLKRCIDATAGAFRGGSAEPVVVIPNGIDLDTYRPRSGVTPGGVRERSGGDLVLLWPHRPDPRKGIAQAIGIAGDLARSYPDRNIRLLVPEHVDAAGSSETREFYDNAVQLATKENVKDALEFTPWWSGDETAIAYAYADVTLCPGNFIESFSLAAHESLACGTPVVAASVGALRDLPDHPDIHMFSYGDMESAAKASLAASEGMTDVDGIRALLSEKYSFRQMQKAYVAAITGVLREPPPAPALVPPGKDLGALHQPQGAPGSTDRFSLAPWCNVGGERVYNDYDYGWSHRAELATFLARIDAQVAEGHRTENPEFTRESAIDAGVSPDQLERALRDGVIVRT